ncbi:MAG TPA: hypothetical protein VG500_04045 [Gemmatimonadales bacterium]|jgi:hypothetical protein|nr:hypothetical protein [Gemmatimonadales bacterium]
MPSDNDVQEMRLRRLEHELQRTRMLMIGSVFLGATLALSGFRRDADEVVRAERVELVSRQGIRQAILGADTLGFAVTLLNQEGRPAGSLRLSPEPRVAVETGRGREVAGLGAPKLHNLKE